MGLATSDRLKLMRPTAVNSILAEVRQVQSQGVQPVSLMRGEPDFATPQPIIAAAIEALQSGRTAYPNNLGEPALREAVARTIADRFQVDYAAENQVLITTGATLGVYAALASVLNDGDEVLLAEPIYDAYHSVVVQAGGIPKPVAAGIEGDGFRWQVADVDAACSTKTKVLLLNTPWNPTGKVLTRDELTELMAVARKHNLVVVSDEIYDQFVYDGATHVSPVEISADARCRTILVNSLSKTYAMTGWRLGYCVGPADIIRAMYLVLQQSSRGPATFVQDAGLAALSGSQACVREMREEYARRRARVMSAMESLNEVRVLPPAGGFFAMLDVRSLGKPSNDIRRHLLNQHQVVVMHGSAYGPAAEGTLRVAYASGGQKLADGLERLAAGLAEL